MNRKLLFGLALAGMTGFTACNDDHDTGMPDYEEVTAGYYILCEGTGQGAKDGSLSYYDMEAGTLTNGVYAAANPGKTIGDTPNDIEIYGSKMYITAWGEDKVLVLNAKDAKLLHEIALDGARSMVCHEGYVYVSSYAGNVTRIDTVSYAKTVAPVTGKNCEDIDLMDGKLYVAVNATPTGGQMSGNTVSVLTLSPFQETDRITVADNVSGLKACEDGFLYVQSSGDYYAVEGQLFRVNVDTKAVVRTFDNVGPFTIYKKNAYSVYSSWTLAGYGNYRVSRIDLVTNAVTDFLSSPASFYKVITDPHSGYVYYTSNYWSNFTSTVSCYDPQGVLQHTTGATGAGASAIAFYNKLVEKK